MNDFTRIYLDFDEVEKIPFHYVRIVGGDSDLFSHGLGLANKFKTEAEAIIYANKVEEYLKSMFEEQE